MDTNWNWLQGTSNGMDGGMAPAPAFAGQKLVVVGGSSGMGRQTAVDVVAAGGSAVIIGQDPDKVADTVKELSESGMAYGITADLTDRMAVDAVCRQLGAEHADATLLVNAAGLFLPKPFLDHTGADYDVYQELNRAMFFITQTVARGMVAHGQGGSIVNIGSLWANEAIGATPSSAYSLAKGGLHALTRNLALELAPHQIRVNTVAPGRGRHPDLREVRAEGPAGDDAAQLRRLPPAGPDRHRPRPGQHHHVPAVASHQLGHRGSLERRRRRHGRTQLVPAAPPAAGPRAPGSEAWRGRIGRNHPEIRRRGSQPHSFWIESWFSSERMRLTPDGDLTGEGAKLTNPRRRVLWLPLDHDFQRVRLGRVRERVVGGHHVVQR